jgi:hypothetical protein
MTTRVIATAEHYVYDGVNVIPIGGVRRTASRRVHYGSGDRRALRPLSVSDLAGRGLRFLPSVQVNGPNR